MSGTEGLVAYAESRIHLMRISSVMGCPESGAGGLGSLDPFNQGL